MLEKVPARYCLLVLLALIVANVWLYRALSAPKTLEVVVLAVGKGDATLVQTPSGQTLLVDTGPDASILRALGEALPMWRRNIGTVVLTSDKGAQTGGLAILKSRYRAGQITTTGGRETPYGSTLVFDTNTFVTVTAPGTFSISHDGASLTISSSTPHGTYTPVSTTFFRR